MALMSQYKPPGVYVDVDQNQIVTPGAVPNTVVTIVGPSRGFQMHTQPLALSTTPTTLARAGVLPDAVPTNDPAGVPVTTVTKIDGTPLVKGTHYNLNLGALASDTSSIVRVTGSETASPSLAEGEDVIVSFAYADESYYAVREFSDYTLVEQVYGPAMVQAAPTDPTASHVSSPLSLAARTALENGASRVLCVSTEPPISGTIDVATRFREAYAKIESIHGVTIVVPVFANQEATAAAYAGSVDALISDVRVHVEQASNRGFGRIAMVGLDSVYDDVTPAPTASDARAQALDTKRLVLAYPNRMSMNSSAAGQSTTVGGQYLAAAYAGRLASNPMRRGLTHETVFGFSGIPQTVLDEMTLDFRNTLSASGVTVTEPGRSNRLTIRHGVTTKVDDLLSREIAIVRTGDALYQTIAEGMDEAGRIGDPIDDDTSTVIEGDLTGLLEEAMSEGIILDYSEVTVTQQVLPLGDPTAFDVRFTYRPFLSLNYINVFFSIDLTTGITEITEEEVA